VKIKHYPSLLTYRNLHHWLISYILAVFLHFARGNNVNVVLPTFRVWPEVSRFWLNCPVSGFNTSISGL